MATSLQHVAVNMLGKKNDEVFSCLLESLEIASTTKWNVVTSRALRLRGKTLLLLLLLFLPLL